MRRGRRVLWIALAVVATIVAIPVAIVAYSERYGWDWTKPWIERGARTATGREVELEGPLDVDLGLHPRVVAGEVRFANAEWSETPRMFGAAEVGFQVRLLPLLLGRVRFERLEIDGASLLLETDERGRRNWPIGGRDERKRRFEVSLPDEIDVRDSVLHVVDRERKERYDVDFDVLAARGGEQLDVSFVARGRYRSQPMWARGRIGSLEDLRANEPLPLRAEARIGPTRAHAVGLIQNPAEFDGVNVQLRLEGGSLSELWPLLRLPLAPTPPYRVAGRLRREGDTWSLERFGGVVGKSDLGGTLAVTRREEHRPLLRAALRSRSLDLDDVEGFWGRPVAEEKSDAQATGQPVFSDRPFSFEKLHAMDAAVDYRAGRVRGRSMLDDVSLKLELVGGRLRLDPLALGFAGGRIASHATVDARQKPARVAGDVVLQSIDVARLVEEARLDATGSGTVGGRAEIATSGTSLRSLASNLDGDFGFVMQDAELSDTLVELAALDLGEVLVRKVKGEHSVPIRCMVGVFDIEDGKMTAEQLLLDTKVDRLVGEGTIDLAQEKLDLEIYEHPRRFTFGSLSSPIRIEGTLADRKARLDRKALLKRGGAAVILGALVHPAAALLALVELEGKKEPGACREAIEDYRRIAASEPSARARGTREAPARTAKPTRPAQPRGSE